MTMRNARGRVLKLEHHKRWATHPDHFLLIWYSDGDDASAAVGKLRGMFGPNDKVGAAPWIGDDVPKPRWLKNYPKDLTDRELDCVIAHLEFLARSEGASTADIDRAVADYQATVGMTDQQLAFRALRVDLAAIGAV